VPATLVAGAGLVLALALLVAADVALRGGAVVPRDPLPPPEGAFGALARAAAENATPVFWAGYLMMADGFLELRGGSPARARPALFAFAFLTGVPVWLFYDAANFALLGAWDYHGLPESMVRLLPAYLVSFGAITPAMLLAAEAFRRLTPLGAPRLPALRLGRGPESGLMAAGAALVVLALALGSPLGAVPLWLGPPLLLDPLNRRLGAPSLLGDLAEGRWGRLLSLGAGGLLCGLLWEGTNYWAATKWTYDLPFLGALEGLRYFEMPALGLGGFVPFAPGCWAALQTLLWSARRIGLGGVERPPRDAIL
jgi:hypothetical protein